MKLISPIFYILFTLLLLYTDSLEVPSPISLQPFNVKKDAITLSGFSGGSAMATQFHVAHSRIFHGAALFSQAFYRCGHSSLEEWNRRCGTNTSEPYNVTLSISDAISYENEGLIDPLRNLEHQRVFIWIGELDEYISPQMGLDSGEFYGQFIPGNRSISTNLFPAKHLFPTSNYGEQCEKDGGDFYYLGNCNYSGAYKGLEYILRDVLHLQNPEEKGTQIQVRELQTFNQAEFYPEGRISEVAMGEVGFLYVPTECRNSTSQCLLHINFQGCSKSKLEIAFPFITNSGLLEVAEENGIIMLFPLTIETKDNWGGCWDFFSYTGPLFATKNGSQIQVVKSMIDRILNEEDLRSDGASQKSALSSLGIIIVVTLINFLARLV